MEGRLDVKGSARDLRSDADAARSSALPLTVPAVLRAAADLIEPEGKWTQGDYARNTRLDVNVDPIDPSATCFCMMGAIYRAAGVSVTNTYADIVIRARNALRRVTVMTTGWNDADGRTQAEVVAALRRAADLAEDDGALEAPRTDASQVPGIIDK